MTVIYFSSKKKYRYREKLDRSISISNKLNIEFYPGQSRYQVIWYRDRTNTNKIARINLLKKVNLTLSWLFKFN